MRTQEKEGEKLSFITYDLNNERWTGEPYELELPEEATAFTAVVKQRNRENEAPHLAIRLPSGAIHARHLNVAGSDWTEGDEAFDGWDYLVGWHQGSSYSALYAMVDVPDPTLTGFILFVGRLDGLIYYRIFGEVDDGYWRRLSSSPATQEAWQGAVILPQLQENFPGTPPSASAFNIDIYVFFQWATSGHSWDSGFLMKPGPLLDQPQSVSSFEEFDSWLQAVTGISLAGWLIDDATVYSGMSLLDFFTLSLEKNKESISEMSSPAQLDQLGAISRVA